MLMLTQGIVLFAGAIAPSLKTGCLDRLSGGGCKSLFSLLLLGAFALIILGWRSAATG